MLASGHAGQISRSRCTVLLHLTGEAGAGEPSVAEDTRTGSRGAEGTNAQPGKALCQRWAPVGAAGAVVLRAAAPGLLWHPLGAAVDGAVGLQSSVPLVCRAFA